MFGYPQYPQQYPQYPQYPQPDYLDQLNRLKQQQTNPDERIWVQGQGAAEANILMYLQRRLLMYLAGVA